MAKKNPNVSKLKMILPERSMGEWAEQLGEIQAGELLQFINRPNVSLYPDRTTTPYALNVSTEYGSIHLDHTLQNVDKVYVGGVAFEPVSNDIAIMSELLDGEPENALQPRSLVSPARGRKRRRANTGQDQSVPFEEIQVRAEDDLSKAGIGYTNFFNEMRSVFNSKSFDLGDIMNELRENNVDEPNIPHFLTHESLYKREVVSQLYGLNYGTAQLDYNFEPVTADDSFLGRLMTRVGVDNAEYDSQYGVLKVGERLITNLPKVDEKGVFSNARGTVRYIPYHIGYFAEGEGTRVERLRHIDPVEKALKAVELQYKLTSGDIKFKTILDVSRNLPDFDNHPYGEEILETYKRKVVLDKNYEQTNSLLAEYQNRTDDLGAVKLTMLDDDAKGLIDPLGTSNGSNLGMIFYLTEDAKFNPDGTFTKGQAEHSPVGNVMKNFEIDTDNFNRHQMSFNAMLTSTGVHKMKVAYAEFAMWNAEDAVVLTEKGARNMAIKATEHDLEGVTVNSEGQYVKDGRVQRMFKGDDGEIYKGVAVGDKVTDMHGNKSVSSLIINPDMNPEQAKAERLNNAVEFAKLNPDLDMIVSPVSLASRLNMGVAHEGLVGEKQDLYLPNGEVVKGGITEVMYMTLPQTAEHKSKDYGIEGNGRKYSTLFRHALASKVGDDLYREGLIREDVRNQHLDEVATHFNRLGIGFKNDKELLKDGNILGYVPDQVTVSADDLSLKSPAVIRLSLINQMKDNAVNIDLGDNEVVSPMTGRAIKDASGRNVIPIRVPEGETIPYRYTEVFDQLSRGNFGKNLQNAYSKAVAIDYNNLTTKDNAIKNIDTMTFFDDAKTEMISPDPRLKLGQVSTSVDDTRVIAHRDPCVQSGNVISMENVGGNQPNMTHINPLMVNQVDGDFDSDTMGLNGYKNLTLTEEQKQEFFNKSSVYEQLNRYGEVFLGTNSSHFKAGVLVNGLDDSNITFKDGKSNMELAKVVEDLNAQIVDSPKSYGAYALSFENENTLKETLGRLADDGIKGNRQDMERHFNEGYTVDEDKAVAKALIAKSEWTGLAGSTTNKLVAGFGDNKFDPELTRVSMDVTYSMTQSVLQLKKNADKLPEIDNKITQMKTIMDGRYDIETSRTKLLDITKGLAPVEAVNKFVDVVKDRQERIALEKGEPMEQQFGKGVLHSTGASNMAFAFMSESTFNKHIGKQIQNSVNEQYALSQEDLDDIMKEFESSFNQFDAGH